ADLVDTPVPAVGTALDLVHQDRSDVARREVQLRGEPVPALRRGPEGRPVGGNAPRVHLVVELGEKPEKDPLVLRGEAGPEDVGHRAHRAGPHPGRASPDVAGAPLPPGRGASQAPRSWPPREWTRSGRGCTS